MITNNVQKMKGTIMRTAKEILKDFKGDYGWKFWDEAMEFLLDWQAEHEDLGIIDESEIDEIIVRQAQESGYQRVACFLSGIIDNLNSCNYKVDGYGNLETIDESDIECWLDDIASDRL